MRLLAFCFKAILFCAVLIGLASGLNYLRTGYFWIPTIDSVKSGLNKPSMQTLPVPKEAIYKWREQGEWVYGDSPPEGVNAQRVSGEQK